MQSVPFVLLPTPSSAASTTQSRVGLVGWRQDRLISLSMALNIYGRLATWAAAEGEVCAANKYKDEVKFIPLISAYECKQIYFRFPVRW